MNLLWPSAPAFGQTDKLTRSLLVCEQDQWATRENAELDHRRGQVLQLGAIEDEREVRQTRERRAASSPRRSLKKDHSEK